MLNTRNSTKYPIAMLFVLFPLLVPAETNARTVLIEYTSGQNNSTFVSYRTDPEHYDVAGNATRTCGPGYNPMDKRHRENHQYKRPHSHAYAPWRQGCKKK